jgi:arylsulfatase A-like enzyme
MHESGRGKRAPVINRQFLAFIDQYASRPFFAYLCYMDANQSFYAKAVKAFWEPVPSLSEVRAAYENGLRTLDEYLGDLFRALERRGLMDNTIVVLTSDHGQSLGAKSGHDHDPAGHGTSLYAEQTRVPLFLSIPGRDLQGVRISEAVSNAGIAATLARLVGAEERSFAVPALPFPGGVGNPAPALMTLNYQDRGLRAAAWNGHHYIQDSRRGGGEELYQLSSDPLEQKNLAPGNRLTVIFRDLLKERLGTAEPLQARLR